VPATCRCKVPSNPQSSAHSRSPTCSEQKLGISRAKLGHFRCPGVLCHHCCFFVRGHTANARLAGVPQYSSPSSYPSLPCCPPPFPFLPPPADLLGPPTPEPPPPLMSPEHTHIDQIGKWLHQEAISACFQTWDTMLPQLCGMHLICGPNTSVLAAQAYHTCFGASLCCLLPLQQLGGC
jgi:hypothetical protein